MDAKLKRIYEPADLGAYSLRDRLAIRLAARVFGAMISILGRTIRFEVRGREHLESIMANADSQILTLWHENVFLSIYYMRGMGVVVMSSKSFDGEYSARFLTRFGFGTVRGSSSRGGADALVKMIRVARKGVRTAFTVDGPRGPRRVVKPGVCALAMKSGGLIYPASIEPAKFWTLKSWDRMRIPKPFSRALVIVRPPIAVAPDADADEFAARLAELQAELDVISEFGEKWRQSFN